MELIFQKISYFSDCQYQNTKQAMKTISHFLLILFSFLPLSFIDAQETESMDEKEMEEQMQKLLGSMFNNDVELPPQYIFDTQVKMRFKDGKEESTMTFMLSKDDGIFGFKDMVGPEASEEGEEFSHMIIDSKNEVMITYMIQDGKKMAMKLPSMFKLSQMDIQSMENGTDEEEGSSPDYSQLNENGLKIEKTGNYPVIMGQKCTEYRMDQEEDDHYAILAFCDQSDMQWMDIYKGMIGMNKMPMMQGYGMFSEGMMMKMSAYKKKNDKLENEMEVMDIKQEQQIIDNSEWNFNMGF